MYIFVIFSFLCQIGFSALLHQDKRQHCVRAEAKVVREEALPQTQHALVLHHSAENVDDALVLGNAVGVLDNKCQFN